MDWNEFARECGPLYPHVMNALAIYKARVQDACAQALSEHLDELCSLFGSMKDDLSVAPYAEPDKLPRGTKEYLAIGARVRIGNVDRIWFYLSYYPADISGQFDHCLIWQIVQKIN